MRRKRPPNQSGTCSPGSPEATAACSGLVFSLMMIIVSRRRREACAGSAVSGSKRRNPAKVPNVWEPFSSFGHSNTALAFARNSAQEVFQGAPHMALAHAIAEHLPYLRRYARALSGTQSSGDAYVRACLEAIVADSSVLGADLPPRVGLYRLFHKIWGSTDPEARSLAGTAADSLAASTAANTVERRLVELTPAH